MKQDLRYISRLASLLGIASALSLGATTSAATLMVTDWTTLPFPPGADHADTYILPHEFSLSASNPITQIEMDYRNLPNVPGIGIHEIKSATFLFKPADVVSTTIIENTVDRFWARIVFKPGLGGLAALANPSAPAFLAFHGGAGGAFTSANWTVTYQDGTTAISNNGIIPEPGTLAAGLVSSTLALVIRRRPRSSAPT